uniref:Uncharacterized protein n=1 Tax=Triticum urartu TaxID=4572 RepID=A0A8R7UDY6_TRIUA
MFINTHLKCKFLHFLFFCCIQLSYQFNNLAKHINYMFISTFYPSLL